MTKKEAKKKWVSATIRATEAFQKAVAATDNLEMGDKKSMSAYHLSLKDLQTSIFEEEEAYMKYEEHFATERTLKGAA